MGDHAVVMSDSYVTVVSDTPYTKTVRMYYAHAFAQNDTITFKIYKTDLEKFGLGNLLGYIQTTQTGTATLALYIYFKDCAAAVIRMAAAAKDTIQKIDPPMTLAHATSDEYYNFLWTCTNAGGSSYALIMMQFETLRGKS